MKYLQTFNERKFYTVKYDNQELSIDDIQNGEWSLTDHLNPKLDKLIMALGDMKARVNTHGSKVYKDEAKKIDLMYELLTTCMQEVPCEEPVAVAEVDINITTDETATMSEVDAVETIGEVEDLTVGETSEDTI